MIMKTNPEDCTWKMYGSNIRGLYYKLLHLNTPEEIIS